jgi:WD40 repeat protein
VDNNPISLFLAYVSYVLGNCLNQFLFMQCSGSSSLSPDFRHILVYNLCNGLDLYKLRSKNLEQSYTFTADADVNYPLKVAFTNNGQSVVCGAQDGKVRIWNRITGMQEQILVHEGKPSSCHVTKDCFIVCIDHLIQGICVRSLSLWKMLRIWLEFFCFRLTRQITVL